MAAKRKGKRVHKRRGIRANKRNQMMKKKMAKNFALIGAGCVILIFFIYYLSVRSFVNKVEDKIVCTNVFVGEVDLTGMNAKEARAALEAHFAEDANITITMSAEEKKVDTTLGEIGATVENMDSLIEEALAYGKEGSIWKRKRQLKALEEKAYVIEESFKLDEGLASSVLKEKIATLENGAMNATITKTAEGFEITEGKEGNVVNVEKSLEVILEHLNKGWNHEAFEAEMVLEKGKPAVMAEDLAEIKDVLGQFSTDAGGGDRWQNLKAGSDMLNGTILMPGEEISVYNATAPYDAEHGYVQAGTYENGEIVPDWGGGICQVSTTLYNAVIYAELEVIERYPHSMTVSYVDPSRDAAIAGGYMDFRFKNSYDTPIYIYSEIDDENRLTFIIYGKETRPENRTIEFESETISIEEYKVTYQENPGMSLGNMEYTGNPHSGRDACLWKIVYEDGVEVSREKFNTSYYMKVDEVVEVGTAGAGAALGAIQSAIGSQDYDRIIDAINSAY